MYFAAFARALVGLIFCKSLLSKIQDTNQFKATILTFNIIPENASSFIAYVFIFLEFLTVFFMLIGTEFLTIGFMISVVLLSVYSFALISILYQQKHIPCNCFGKTEKMISNYDVVRNILFILFSLVGLSNTTTIEINRLHIIEWAIILATSIVFLAIWLGLQDIIKLFRS